MKKKSVGAESSRTEKMSACFVQLKSDKEACFEMLDKMLKKIIDTEDNKFRTVKQ